MQVTYHILLIGAGQIGSRHLQALALSDINIEISVVDSSTASLAVAKDRYKQVFGLFGLLRKS